MVEDLQFILVSISRVIISDYYLETMWLLSLSEVCNTSSEDSTDGWDSVDHWGVSSFFLLASVFDFRSPTVGNMLFCSACSVTDQFQDSSFAKLSAVQEKCLTSPSPKVYFT